MADESTGGGPALRPREVGTLATGRLLLRPVSVADADAVYGYLSRADVCRYLPHEPLTHEEVVRRLPAHAGGTRIAGDGDGVRLAVVPRDGTAEDGAADGTATRTDPVGEVHLQVHSAGAATLEIGWIFAPHIGGRGYATEAARELLEYAFTEVGAHRVVARMHPDNTASARLCERLGMRHEALHRADIWVTGAWEDTSVYAMLDHEWSATAP
ncbi:GNAT family N-acetyltransferase [Saccharomonospora iraqiensis]|uniref:GNAT family N-acetyltransferase n=1 Tax=Saccharomonospora iraqiensis TaxID=52698 RepID=UPI0002F0B032|nr:GNAT family N-acetyltransferase [Saccharomonospora iraqiensis]